MPRELVRDAIAESEHATPDMRAAVRLRGARVLQRFDPDEARRRLDEAIAIISSIRDEETAQLMRFAAIPLAATVAPDLAIRLQREWRGSFGHLEPPVDQTINNMAEHGHRAEAVKYLLDPDPTLPFPFMMAMNVARDAETRSGVLRASVAAMRRALATPGATGPASFHLHHFLSTFSHQWRQLPADEALAAAHDIAAWIRREPDQQMSSGFGGSSEAPRFSSSRERKLYDILGPLQHLDPEFTRGLLAEYRQLARAAARYPFGMESEIKELEAKTPPPPADLELRAPTPDMIYFGHSAIPADEAIATAFAAPLAAAARTFAADADEATGNSAPVECWPSASEYRTILFRAGEHEGRDATKYLAQIPSDDIRRLSAIELAAALVGLPHVGGMTRGPGGGRGPKRAASPSLMTRAGEAMVKRFLKGKQFGPLAPPRRPEVAPSMDVRISTSRKNAGDRVSGGCGPDFWTIEGAPLKPVIARLWDVQETRVDLPPSLAKDRYDFVLVLPRDGTQEEMRRLMREGITKHFAVTIASESRTMDTLVVSAPDGIALDAESEDGGFHSAGLSMESVSFRTDVGLGSMRSPRQLRKALGVDEETIRLGDLDAVFDMQMASRETPQDFEGYKREMSRRFSRASAAPGGTLTSVQKTMTIGDLCELLESSLLLPVLDETGLTASYAFKVSAHVDSTRAFLVPLADQTGLRFTDARRDVPMVVVTR